MAKITCQYCSAWIQSHVKFRATDLEEKKKSQKGNIIKICSITNKSIKSDDEKCEYFRPCDTFYCNKNSNRLPMVICLHRRVNWKKYSTWRGCRKCRQFSKEIQPILEEYHMNMKRIKNPPEDGIVSKLKRRKKKDEKPIKKLKRRKLKTEAKKLKRRRLKQSSKPRKLKRRK